MTSPTKTNKRKVKQTKQDKNDGNVPYSVLLLAKWLQLGTQSQNFNSNIVWRKLNLPEWLMKADLNCRMRGKQVNLLAWLIFTTWRGLRNRRTTRTNLWMKDRRQEVHIMAQEEGLGLNSFFEFQAFAMLNYLRMKSGKKLPAKDAMTAVQIDTSYRIH